MASVIEAIIYDGDGRPAALAPGFRAVSLSAGLSMLPATAEVATRAGHRPGGGQPVRAGWVLRQWVAD